jgi:hypothetical protein
VFGVRTSEPAGGRLVGRDHVTLTVPDTISASLPDNGYARAHTISVPAFAPIYESVAIPEELVVAWCCCVFAPIILNITGVFDSADPDPLVTDAAKETYCPIGYEDAVM